jgi:hypothetical protein
VLRLTLANTLSHALMKRVLDFLYTGAVAVVRLSVIGLFAGANVSFPERRPEQRHLSIAGRRSL